MAVQLVNDWRRPGCGDGCRVVQAFLPGLTGRERFELHDPDAHESYAARDGRPLGMVIESGPLVIDLWTYTATCNGEALALSPGSWTLLRVFGGRPDGYCSLSMLSVAMFGIGATTHADKHAVRVAVRRLRRALGAAAYLIETHQGVGYRMRIAPPGPPTQPLARWSLKYDACTSCGTTALEHDGKGLCGSCRNAAYRREREGQP